MRRWGWLLLLTLLLAAFPALGEEYVLGGAALTVEDGVVTGVAQADGSLKLEGIYVDVGCDGAFLQRTLGFQRFDRMNTWDLADIVPLPRTPVPPASFAAVQQGDTLTITQELEGLTVTLTFQEMASALSLTATLHSAREKPCEIQGVHFQLRGIQVPAGTTFRFPGNTPGDLFELDSLGSAVRQTDYCNPLVLVRTGEEAGFNALFLDEEEKWSTGVYRDRAGHMNISFLAMVEGMLAPGETMEVSGLFLQTTRLDAYAPVQSLYQELGYHAPQTEYTSGPLYSCHPAGTMDSGFMDTKTMRAYASSLPALAEMGIESVWVLPIFEHTGRGVYEPTDQHLIDPRYGTDEDVRAYVDAAHALGMRVLFDYVPHGPYPEDPLAQQHPAWCSVSRRGLQQIEWECVSFDMANPDYQRYTEALSQEHVQRFQVDGGRIDCAMGGLSNWQPQAGNRASSSGLRGGQEIVSALRSGFEKAGKEPLLLPENFHPVPFYAEITDIYYDMPLYYLMFSLRQKGVDETTFACTLAQWLDSEHRASVPGQKKLRYLGNHDTVSWTWDKQRPTSVYGVEKAKALWTLMSTIDGVPFLYMGDEDSALYHADGLNLTNFFTELFAARRMYLSDDMETEYLLGQDTVVAFRRRSAEASRLVLVNLGGEAVDYPLSEENCTVLYGQGTLEDGFAHLPAYGSLLLDVTP